MRLVLTVNSMVLDRVELDPSKLKHVDYLHSLQRLLILKHELAILAQQGKPQFYIETESQLNTQKN